MTNTEHPHETPPPHAKGEPAAPPSEAEELGFELPAPAKLSWARGIAAGTLALAVLGGAFVAGYLPRHRARAHLNAEAVASSSAPRRVQVITPTLGASTRALVLTGSVMPLEEATLYPRASGYVRRWLVDMGEQVTEGQLLAELETPELDQELAQDRAMLAQAEANVGQTVAARTFAMSDVARYAQMVDGGFASRQDFEQRQATAGSTTANVSAAQAAVNVQRANVRRLEQLRSFARVVAPFAGTITMRSIERGTLVAAGTTTPLFHLAALDPVRVYIQVPQDVAPSMHVGQTARVNVREYPDHPFAGTVAHLAGTLDPVARTMNTEVRVPNGDPANRLLAGMFAEVAVTLPTPHRVFEVPATALLSDARGVRLAVVGTDDLIHLVTVTIERDTGAVVQLSRGLEGGERVVRIASVELTEGLHVEAVR